ncbi:MAG: Helicase associated domain protein [Sulfurimonas sp.]|uniref:DEAD/DEAH box helicase n=1 Tax=Sulfurimonas sp. TaxID=2022749 RepID=UPI0026027C58|nr:DEAD/DEAH box helicase [Sulfurimonas sp.]MDD3476612.1 Helicase associated domain protein [Sulfurimonas sp.]
MEISKSKLLQKLNIKKDVFNNMIKLFDKSINQESFSPAEVKLFLSYLASTNIIKGCVISDEDYSIAENDVKERENIADLSKKRRVEKQQIEANSQKITCRPHQDTAVDDIYSELITTSKCQYISPCGTGKTLVSQKVTEKMLSDMLSSITVVILPSLDLLSQFHRSWYLTTSIRAHLSPFVLCSDDEIINGDGISNKSNYSSIKKGCFTEDLKNYIVHGDIDHKLIFSTYQSVHLLSEVTNELGIVIDIGIFDEAHKTTGEFNKSFSYALYDHNIRISKRLFMTASQKINPYSSNTLTMDNELVYGKVAHRLSMRKAIEDGIIRDYQIVIVTVDKDLMDAEDRNKNEYRQHLIVASLAKVIQEKNIKNGILFQKTIQDSKSFVDFAIDSGHLPTFKIKHVDGTMKTSERKRHIHLLSSKEPAILSNSKLLSEGIDTPSLDMVGFMNPTKSMVDIIQRLGRAQRKKDSEDNRKGYLFLPLFIGSDTDFDDTDSGDMENWRYIIDILSVLREVDGKVKAGIDNFKKDGIFPNDIVEVIFDDENKKIEYNDLIIEKLASSVKVSYHEELNTNWSSRYNELKAFMKERGRMPKRIKEEMALSEWCSTQRDKKRNGTIAEERKNLLDDISFSWNRFEDAWEENFNNLVDFRNINGCDPKGDGTGKEISKEECKTAKWLSHQKIAYRNGTLREDRYELLKPLVENWDLRNDVIWEENFKKFQAFLEENKRFPTDKEGEERWIYRWVNKQKVTFESGNLKSEYTQRLSAVYPDWLLTGKERLWKEQYLKSETFLKEKQKIPLTTSDDKTEASAGRWLLQQKKLYASSQLTTWQIEMVLSLVEEYNLEEEFATIKTSKTIDKISFKYSGVEDWIDARDYEKRAGIVKFSISKILQACKNNGIDIDLISKKDGNIIYVNYQYGLEAKAAHDEIISYLQDMQQKGVDYNLLAKELNASVGTIYRFFTRTLYSGCKSKNVLIYLSMSKLALSIYNHLKNTQNVSSAINDIIK